MIPTSCEAQDSYVTGACIHYGRVTFTNEIIKLVSVNVNLLKIKILSKNLQINEQRMLSKS
jgi:hypothetical protein